MTTDNRETFTLEEATFEEIQEALHKGELTSAKLTKYYLERIERYDRNGPRINSLLEINPKALEIAVESDANRKGNEGLLYGIPILLKDNIDTADDMPASAGSVALANNTASRDAFLVKKLRNAGAIILGKVNMSEFANFVSYDLPNGFSSRGGQVLNPYGPGLFDVGGSSSGTGAAVASNFAAAGIGTETSGSILSPSSSNSLVGIKPTLGLVSRTGIIPLARSQDTAGPMARTVADAAVVLTVIAGYDPEDAATETSVGKTSEDYTEFLQRDGLKGARIGVDRDAMNWLTDEETALMERAIEELKAEGAVLVDPIEIPQLEYNLNVLSHEFKHDINAYLRKASANLPVRSLADIIAYNEKHKEKGTIPYGQGILEDAQAMSDDPLDPEYLNNRSNELLYSGELGIDAAMKVHDLDAILYLKNHGSDMAAKAGYPSITVPGGYTKSGEPAGVSFTATAYSEPALIKLAYAYEQATKHRIPPNLKYQ